MDNPDQMAKYRSRWCMDNSDPCDFVEIGIPMDGSTVLGYRVSEIFPSSTLHQSAVVREMVDSKAHGSGTERMSIDINAYTTATRRWCSYPVVEVRPDLQLNGPQPSTYVAC